MNTILPPEILVKILLSLNSIELTRVSVVCRFWKDLIEAEPCLRCARFKQPSLCYYDEGCEPVPSQVLVNDTRIRFHPAMQRMSYRMGDPISAVHIHNHDISNCCMSLMDLPLQDDYATIPAITHLDIEINSEESNKRRTCLGLPGIAISVANPTGVRLNDIFSSIVTETTELCDLVSYASGGVCKQRMRPGLTFYKKAEILGKYKSYAGIRSTTMEDGKIKVKLCTVL